MPDDIKPQPEEEPEFSADLKPSEEITEHSPQRKRIKIRKRVKHRVRIKKKPSIKKRLKKIMSYLIWFVVIGGFLVTVFILVKELDIKDENAKKQAPKKKQVYRLPNKMMHALLVNEKEFKKVIHFNQTENNTALNSLT